jgi:8-oxo-dGTP pyrophosphatase MutT (NUDIX family)
VNDIISNLKQPPESQDFFLTSQIPLCPEDAVCALIILEDGRYLLQLRDQKPDIFFPGHWGLFGGAVDEGEEPLAALYRELEEELHLKVQNATPFTKLEFDLTYVGLKRYYRMYYDVQLKNMETEALVLNEGKEMQAFSGKEVLTLNRVTPYDAFALWFHMERRRLRCIYS